MEGNLNNQKWDPTPINHQVKHQEIWSWCCFAIAEVSHDILTHSYIYVWYIFSCIWLIFMVHVGEYTSPMDPSWVIYLAPEWLMTRGYRLQVQITSGPYTPDSFRLPVRMVVGRQHVLLVKAYVQGLCWFQGGYPYVLFAMILYMK